MLSRTRLTAKAKIRNLMSALFTHAMRYEWLEDQFMIESTIEDIVARCAYAGGRESCRQAPLAAD